jgi:threonylcarbamoyladenosine tRNA methylthiotransferase CDKAL1
MKFYIETYGCTANFGNTQDAAEALEEKGHVPSSLEEADAVIVNTCAVTEKTERKILRRLSLLQGKRLVVAGCLSTALPESILLISCRDRLGLLNRSSAEKIADLFGHSASTNLHISSESIPNAPNIAIESRQDLCGIINIATGCNGGCSYCIVRKARGKLISRKPIEVTEDVQRLTTSGIIEVQITAQDTTAYGSDLGTNLAELLLRLTDVPGDFMVRVGMMNPDTVLPIQKELVRAFRSPKIYRFLHIPVQSGSNRILKSMGRRYSVEDFLEIVRTFRSSYPDITIITDAIVGFPGETEKDFRETLSLIESLQPDKVNITRFSPRPGTLAAELYDMPDRIKKDRSRELTSLWQGIAAQRNRLYVGEVLDALVTERGRNGTMKARAKNYLGIVVLGDPELGSSIKVKVTASNPNFLSGHVLTLVNRDQVHSC